MDPAFVAAWAAVRDQVLAYCRRASGGDEGLADQAFRRTAARAARGFPVLGADASLLAWVLTVARAEVCGLAFDRLKAPATNDPPPAPGRAAWVDLAARTAAAYGAIGDGEAAVLAARAELPTGTWEQVGRRVGLGGPLAAARHAWAAGRLRLFLFTRRPDLLGGPELIAVAVAQAEADPVDPLPPAAAAVFRRAVLAGDPDWRRPGWREDLQTACDRVARFLPLP